jgi:hypothetical protein
MGLTDSVRHFMSFRLTQDKGLQCGGWRGRHNLTGLTRHLELSLMASSTKSAILARSVSRQGRELGTVARDSDWQQGH